MKNSIYKKGVSLIETIVYVAIFSIFVVSLSQFSTILTNTRLNTQGILEVNDQGSQVIKLITQTLRNGYSINYPTIGNSGVGLSIVTDIATQSSTVFSQSEGVLYITTGTSAPVALTNNRVIVSNLSFSNLSRINTPDIIKVSFTLTSTDPKHPYSLTFAGSGSLRK